jgi:aquaporin Z
MKKSLAEFFGTFWLVLGGCGSAVLAATFPDVGIGLVGVALAFGLTVLIHCIFIRTISALILNPCYNRDYGRRQISAKEIMPYIFSQI